MQKDQKINFENSVISAIIENNIKVLYRVPKRYVYTNKYLEAYNKRLKNFLLRFWRYLKSHQERIEIYNNDFVISLNNVELTKIRGIKRESDGKGRISDRTTNHYINYLCLSGFLFKVKQFFNEETGEFEFTERNKKVFEADSKARLINSFQLVEYDRKTLDAIESKIELLTAAGITPSRMSSDMLEHNLSVQQAEKIYPHNISGILTKTEDYNTIVDVLNKFISKQGYCTKTQLLLSLRPKGISYTRAAEVMRVFKKDLAELYKYKPPSKAEKELYKLNTKWIYVFNRSGGEPIEEDTNGKRT